MNYSGLTRLSESSKDSPEGMKRLCLTLTIGTELQKHNPRSQKYRLQLFLHQFLTAGRGTELQLDQCGANVRNLRRTRQPRLCPRSTERLQLHLAQHRPDSIGEGRIS